MTFTITTHGKKGDPVISTTGGNDHQNKGIAGWNRWLHNSGVSTKTGKLGKRIVSGAQRGQTATITHTPSGKLIAESKQQADILRQRQNKKGQTLIQNKRDNLYDSYLAKLSAVDKLRVKQEEDLKKVKVVLKDDVPKTIGQYQAMIVHLNELIVENEKIKKKMNDINSNGFKDVYSNTRKAKLQSIFRLMSLSHQGTRQEFGKIGQKIATILTDIQKRQDALKKKQNAKQHHTNKHDDEAVHTKPSTSKKHFSRNRTGMEAVMDAKKQKQDFIANQQLNRQLEFWFGASKKYDTIDPKIRNAHAHLKALNTINNAILRLEQQGKATEYYNLNKDYGKTSTGAFRTFVPKYTKQQIVELLNYNSNLMTTLNKNILDYYKQAGIKTTDDARTVLNKLDVASEKKKFVGYKGFKGRRNIWKTEHKDDKLEKGNSGEDDLYFFHYGAKTIAEGFGTYLGYKGIATMTPDIPAVKEDLSEIPNDIDKLTQEINEGRQRVNRITNEALEITDRLGTEDLQRQDSSGTRPSDPITTPDAPQLEGDNEPTGPAETFAGRRYNPPPQSRQRRDIVMERERQRTEQLTERYLEGAKLENLQEQQTEEIKNVVDKTEEKGKLLNKLNKGIDKVDIALDYTDKALRVVKGYKTTGEAFGRAYKNYAEPLLNAFYDISYQGVVGEEQIDNVPLRRDIAYQEPVKYRPMKDTTLPPQTIKHNKYKRFGGTPPPPSRKFKKGKEKLSFAQMEYIIGGQKRLEFCRNRGFNVPEKPLDWWDNTGVGLNDACRKQKRAYKKEVDKFNSGYGNFKPIA